jgi:hypothetical protein
MATKIIARLKHECGTGCQNCGHKDFYIYKGSGPHVAALKCKKCGSFYKWMSRTDFDAIPFDSVKSTLPVYTSSPVAAPGQLSLFGEVL